MSISDLKIPPALSQWIITVLGSAVVFFLGMIYYEIKDSSDRIEKLIQEDITLEAAIKLEASERAAFEQASREMLSNLRKDVNENRIMHSNNEQWKMQLFRDYELRRR